MSHLNSKKTPNTRGGDFEEDNPTSKEIGDFGARNLEKPKAKYIHVLSKKFP